MKLNFALRVTQNSRRVLSQSNVTYELSNIINMGALVISQLLESAELKGVGLDLDISSIENQSMLEAVEQMTLTGVVSNKARGGGLVSSVQLDPLAIRLTLL